MATQEQVTQIKGGLGLVSEYGEVDFENGFDAWGSMDFKAALPLIKLALSIVDELRLLPLDMLPEEAAVGITNHLQYVASDMNAVSSFNAASESDADKRKANIERELKAHVGELHNLAMQTIPYLAHKHIAQHEAVRNMAQVEREVKELHDRALESASNAESETKEIIQRAKVNAAGVAASQHADHFDNEARALHKTKWLWLFASGVLVTSVVCLAFLWGDIRGALPDNPSAWDLLRHTMEKLTVLAVLFTSAVWCGGEYRSISRRHFTTKHRALSLRTFQTFAAAAVDPAVKDAVLMAATKSIFENAQAENLGAKDAGAGASANINLGKVVKKGMGPASGAD